MTVLKIPDEPTMPATRRCLVCGVFENPKAHIINTSAAWLCPKCKRRLKKMLYGRLVDADYQTFLAWLQTDAKTAEEET